jgi:co-chaperonin GroES (HSP10)
MASVNVRPLGDRVLVQPLEEQEVKKAGSLSPIPPRKNHKRGKWSL